MPSKKQLEQRLDRQTDIWNKLDVRLSELERAIKGTHRGVEGLSGLESQYQRLGNRLDSLTMKFNERLPDPPGPKQHITIRWGTGASFDTVFYIDGEQNPPIPGKGTYDYADDNGDWHALNMAIATEVIVEILEETEE